MSWQDLKGTQSRARGGATRAVELTGKVKEMATNHHSYLDRIVMDPEILVGKPTVRGTRISVELVLKRLSQDLDLDGLFRSYPRLTREDVQACLEFAEIRVRRLRARTPPREAEIRRASAV